jgi:hypothetical protein
MLIYDHSRTGSDVLFAFCMEIDPADRPLNLVEADIVEALETCATYSSYSMVRDQKVFLPPHEYIFSLRQAWNMKMPLSRILLEGSESRELGPMREVRLVRGAPVLMLCKKRVF